MGISPKELKNYVIRPTLESLGDYSPAAVNLLLGTAACESELGFHIQQGSGLRFGIGIYRIRATTHEYLWDNFLALQPELASKVRGLASQQGFLSQPNAELATNLSYSTAIAWLLYKQAGIKIPTKANNTKLLATCWTDYYPSVVKHKQAEDFIERYQQVITKQQNSGDLAA